MYKRKHDGSGNMGDMKRKRVDHDEDLHKDCVFAPCACCRCAIKLTLECVKEGTCTLDTDKLHYYNTFLTPTLIPPSSPF